MNRRPQGIKEIREARERSDAERRRLLELYKGHQAAADHERHPVRPQSPQSEVGLSRSTSARRLPLRGD